METGEELSGIKKVRLHALRHSHASLLISKPGVRPKLVSERLCHEKIQTTLDTYSHLYPDQSRNLADQLNCLVDESDEEGEEDNAGKANLAERRNRKAELESEQYRHMPKIDGRRDKQRYKNTIFMDLVDFRNPKLYGVKGSGQDILIFL